MLKKIIKYALRTLLVIVVVLLLVPALLYIPAVQDFVRTKAVGYASGKLGMNLSIERIRLTFPLRLSVDNTLLVDKADTLVRCKRLSLDVAAWPLLRKEIAVRSFELDSVAARLRDSVSGMDMRIAAGSFYLNDAKADLSARSLGIMRIGLSEGDVFLDMRETAPREKTDSAAASVWAIDVDRLTVENTAFGMRTSPVSTELSVRLPEGAVDECRVRLESRQVWVKSVVLNRGEYAYRTAPADARNEGAAKRDASLAPAPDTGSPTVLSLPWTVRAGRVAMTDNGVEYAELHHLPAPGFDPRFIVLSKFDLSVDSVYNRGSDVALRIRRMTFAERCGWTLRDLSGEIRMDTSGIALSGLDLSTPYSMLQADVSAGDGILQLKPDAPLSVSLSAEVNTKDVEYLCPSLIPAVLDDRAVRLDLKAAGTLNDIGRIGLDVSSPGHLAFTADGRAKYLLDAKRLDASARFEGDFRDMAFAMVLLPDTALRRRLTVPDRIGLHGSLGADKGLFSTTSVVTVDGGSLYLNGMFDSRDRRYDAGLRCDSFPLNRFLPADSLGMLDMDLKLRGRGLDPLSAQTRANLLLQIKRAEYRGHDFGGLDLTVELDSQRLSGRISDRDAALRLSLGLTGILTPEKQQFDLSGDVCGFDLAEMGLTREKWGGSFALEAGASATGPGFYSARLALDSIEIRSKNRTDRIRPTSLAFATDSAETRAGLTSGDLSLSFLARDPLDSLMAALTRSADVLSRQIRSQDVDMEPVKSALPDFRLRVTAGRNNILNNYLKSRKAAFRALDVEGVNCDSLPLSVQVRVDGLSSGKIVLDTVTAGIRQQGSRLEYDLGLANAPGNLDHVARAELWGHVAGNRATVELSQRNRAGAEGFRFGFDVLWTDSLVQAGMTPRNPLFGFDAWEVNPDNYIEYRFDKHFAADLDLTHGAQRFALHTVPVPDSSDGIRLDVAGLNIGSILGMLPSAPPFGGTLGAGMSLNMMADSMSVRGDVSVAGLTYDKQRFGDVGLGLEYHKGREQQGDVRFTLDGAEVLAVQGDYRKEREDPLDLTAMIPGFPLDRANVFLPSDLLALSGQLGGNLHAGGAPDRLKLDGGVQFAQTDVRVPMIGTSFRLSSDTIRIVDSRVLFDEWTVTAPNKSPLTLDGSVDLTDPGNMTADIALRASDFQAVNVARKEGTAVYGKAYLDLDATARGPLNGLVVRGSVALLGGTDISYVMQDSPMEVKERPQNIVTFVSFSDLDSQAADQTLAPVRIGGMDVLFNVDINDDVKAAVDLSSNGENRIDLQGGGNLTYTMNPLGDVRFTGRYVLTGGSVRYNPPVIAQKIFKITPDSYVEWMGDIADPAFNITAVETVRASVTTEDQDSRAVNFDISINIRNTLNDLSISFGLSAPEDLTMQNQLNSLTAEQRANQAMSLLIYNTYSGPGTTAKVNAENPLNSFIQKELNQWAQNNLKGVDLSFGIHSFGEDDPNGQRTDYSYRLSKNLFSNRVRAVIGGTFSSDVDPSQNLRENLIDDISLEYMLTKRDNMFIRLFRHTGYESILEGEITETGVGFVIRKKLLKLTDLFKPTRRKEEKKRRDESDAH